jgi:uncharacterized protein with NRDE domain
LKYRSNKETNKMCVVALALNAHRQWRLVLATNRDELHARPSAPLARWAGEDSHIIAGRDLVSGGTWLGVSESGRLAVVTNIRTGEPPDPAKASRGGLVADYLRGHSQPALAALDQYNPFSLITVGPDGATLSANRPTPIIAPLADGIHGLSNGAIGEQWPRKDRLMQAFTDCLTSGSDLAAALLDLLASESIDDSIFIRNAVYGTRCSTVVLVDAKGAGLVIEQRFGPDGRETDATEITFTFNPEPSPTAP